MTPARIVSVVAIAALVAGLGYWTYVSERSPAGGDAKAPAAGKADDKSAKAPPGKGGPGGPAPVEVARAGTRAMQEDVTAVGTVRANESVVLKPEIAGRISRIAFREGQSVRRGDVLVELDAQVLRAEVAQARAQLELARANLSRTDDLAARNFVSGSAKDQAASSVQVLEAALALATARLDRTVLRAPFDGRTGLRNISVGDFVKDGAELVSLEDLSSVKLDFRLPERFFGVVRAGQPVEFEVDALKGRRFAGSVSAIDTVVDANGRSMLVRAGAANPGGVLTSGMFARVRVVLSQRADAIVVPEEAIVPGATGQAVFRVVERDGQRIAQRVIVTTGMRRDGVVEVVQGISAGDTIVTAGQIRLQRDGLPVRVVEPGAAPRPAGAPGPAKGAEAPAEKKS